MKARAPTEGCPSCDYSSLHRQARDERQRPSWRLASRSLCWLLAAAQCARRAWHRLAHRVFLQARDFGHRAPFCFGRNHVMLSVIKLRDPTKRAHLQRASSGFQFCVKSVAIVRLLSKSTNSKTLSMQTAHRRYRCRRRRCSFNINAALAIESALSLGWGRR